MSYTLKKDGDKFEQHYWNIFLQADFPGYERYWSKYIVPLTNRPKSIHFKSSQALLDEGYSAEDVCKAQLHYTTFRHLIRAFEILNTLKVKVTHTLFDIDIFSEGLFHITAAQDVAFEFLQRVTTPNHFDPWASKKSMSATNRDASKEAQHKWKRDKNYPLQDIRDYRNHLTHGRMSPSIQEQLKVLIPRIGRENEYLDWRLVTDWNPTSITNVRADFDTLDSIQEAAWKKTIIYFNEEWMKII
jgi:hypothetical protein